MADRKVVQFLEVLPTTESHGFTSVLYDDGAMYTRVWQHGEVWKRQALPDDSEDTIHEVSDG